MKTRIQIVAAVVLFGSGWLPLSVQTARAADKLSLKHKFRKGNTTRVTTTIEETAGTKMSRAELAHSMEMKHVLVFEMVYHVTDVTPGGQITLELTYERIKQTTIVNGKTDMTADSKDEAPDESDERSRALWCGLKGLAGLRVTIRLDRDHSVKEIKGFDAFWKGLTGGRAPGAPGKDGPSQQIGDAIEQIALGGYDRLYGEKRLRGLIDHWFTKHASPREVAVGESWTAPGDIDVLMDATYMLGRQQIKTTNTLLGVEQRKGKRCAKIKVVSRLTESPVASFKPAPGRHMPRVKVNTCNVDGLAWFNLDAGQLIESAVQQEIVFAGVDLPRRGAATQPDATAMTEARTRSKTRVTAVPVPSRPTTQPW